MNEFIEWFKGTLVGKALYNFWRMFFSDKTGVSMRKVFAFNFMVVMDIIIFKYTDANNFEFVVGQLIFSILALLGIVMYDQMKTRDKKNGDA